MKPCELCEKPMDEDKLESISYYDLCDLGTALDYSITTKLKDMDLSRVIPGCTQIPDSKSSDGNLATWKTCSACHHSIRTFLGGRSEYAPKHY